VTSMRRGVRVLSRLLVVVLAVMLAGFAGVGGLLWITQPGGDRVTAIPGLSAPVDITIDADGVPRIHAANQTDAAAALGFLHARERMFQMDMMRRAMRGELSEIVGPATLPLDRMMRTLGVRQAAEADLAALPAPTRAMLDAYANGVNAWIAATGRRASIEFLPFGAPRPWTALDCLLWGKAMGLYLSGNWRTELARAALLGRLPRSTVLGLWPADLGGPGRPEADNDMAPRDPALAATAAKLVAALPDFPAPFTLPHSASDAWAVDGRHTATGAPLLAGDPHLAFGMPSIWYLARIDTPGHVLAGATAPGIPFLVLGHNGHIAWSFTTTGADVQDLFVETPDGDDQYMTPDGPRTFIHRSETIHIRGAPDVTLDVRQTRHGPVISDLVAPGGAILAVSMANLMPGDRAAAGLLALNQAEDVAAAGRAAAEITSPVQNLLVADRRSIALFVTGRVPIRAGGDGAMPVSGADGSHDWIGWASGAQLPHVVDPASGRLVNANDRVAPPDFPVFLGRDWFADWRARRIRTLLDAAGRQTPARFAAMQIDAVSVFAQDVLPRLLRITPADARQRRVLALLAAWHANMAINLPQPLIFNAWMRQFRAAILARLGVGDSAAAPDMELVADALGPRGGERRCGGDCTAMLSDALSAALSELAAQYGPNPALWHWGRAHRAVFAHPLLARLTLLRGFIERSIASPGDDTTLFRGGMAPGSFDGASFASVHGASYRGVYDLAALDSSRFVVAPGQSGHIASSLAWNFVRRWRDGGTIALGPEPARVTVHIKLIPMGALP
jgi:penicillin amidase